jgi:hypothetical protein
MELAAPAQLTIAIPDRMPGDTLISIGLLASAVGSGTKTVTVSAMPAELERMHYTEIPET